MPVGFAIDDLAEDIDPAPVRGDARPSMVIDDMIFHLARNENDVRQFKTRQTGTSNLPISHDPPTHPNPWNHSILIYPEWIGCAGSCPYPPGLRWATRGNFLRG